MRRLHCFLWTLLLTVTPLSALQAAEDSQMPAKLHPWGRFSAGSYSVVQITTKTYNEQNQVVGTSISDTTTTLLGIDKEGVTLEIGSCVEVVGKRFDGKPQTIKQGFYGESLCAKPNVLAPTDSQVVVDDRKIPCKVQQVECNDANGGIVVQIYYSTTVAPYVFKRESTVKDADGKVVSSATMEVTSMEMLDNVLGTPMSVFNVKTIRRSPKGTVTTLERLSPEVPGGVVFRSSRELDSGGRTVHRSVLELTEYSTGLELHQKVLGRKPRPRRQKSTTYFEP
jgi:hypothetical protein